MFTAHVESEVEAAHANGPEGHRCRVMHGHTWRLEVEFQYDTTALSEYGWGPDFGAVKAIIRRLDHQNLNDLFTFPPSAENIARWLHTQVLEEYGDKVSHIVITVHEGGGNSVRFGGVA